MAYTDIDDPSIHFQTKLYTGTGNSLALTNDGNSDLKPDFAWIKRRDGAYSHALFDSSRGSTERLVSNLTQRDDTNAQYITSFNTDGFTAGTDANINGNNLSYVAWQWKANGGTTASNTSGSITSTVQANQDAGFSIVTWTGNGQTATLGHGLGVEPEVIIQKARGTTSNWAVYHKQANAAPYNVVTYLNLENVTGSATGSWGTSSSNINSNTFYLKYWFNYNTTNVAYCFASKQGYSKFGSYVGNGNANGAFVYTGFKPAFVLIKKYNTSADSWVILDNKRDPDNVVSGRLFPDLANAESTSTDMVDFLSNGFKLRTSGSAYNGSGVGYIYMAFAENPFTTSTGIPTTAR